MRAGKEKEEDRVSVENLEESEETLELFEFVRVSLYSLRRTAQHRAPDAAQHEEVLDASRPVTRSS